MHFPMPPLSVWILVFVGGYVLLARIGFFTPQQLKLRKKGLNLLLKGRPAEAESCYRSALDLGTSVTKGVRVRLLVCLSDALFDQGRYPEAMQYLTQALEIGDPTGSGQGSMCDLLLAMKKEPEQAIEMADEGLRLTSRSSEAFGADWKVARDVLYETKALARKTRALVQLDRVSEARQTLHRALSNMEASKDFIRDVAPQTTLFRTLVMGSRLGNMKKLAVVNAHWEIGLAFEDLRDKSMASEHFRIVRDTDNRGKYRQLAQRKLQQLGMEAC